jgi:hypothetical protein
LNQPKFAATDNVQTSFFAQQVGGVWRFTGTSAAAPQAAAIGALVRQKSPALAPAEITSTLSSTARPVATNGTADAVGGGYLDADAALAAVVSLPGLSSPPTTVTGDSQVTVNWSGAATDPNFPITGFTVTPYLDGVAQIPATVAAGPMSHLFSGLTNGASYTFTVAATNANGSGPESAQSALVFVGIPGPPTGVTAASGVSEARVSWSAPASEGMTISGYTVDTLSGGGTVLATQNFPSTATTQTIPGLTNGVEYRFRVAVVNEFGIGSYSVASSPITVGVPDPPTGVNAQPGTSYMFLRWVTPSDNGATINSYVITPYLNGTTAMATTTVSPNIYVLVGGLTPGMSYTFTMAAANNRGVGAASAPSAPVIQGSPQAPDAPTAKPNNGSANVTWLESPSNNGSAVTGYTVRAYVGTTQVASHAYPATPRSQLFSGLTNGTTYRFTVAARNTRGLGPKSTLGSAITAGAPAAPTATATPGNARATVNWTAAVANGSAVTSYIVTPYLARVAQTPRTFAAAARTATITGLTNGSTYTFNVSARNARGTGPQSVGVAVVVGSPLAPTAPTAKPGNERATIHWTAPTINNGAAITGYIITPYRDGIAQFPWTFASTATTQTVTSLENALRYTFKISARNSRGMGPRSVASPMIIIGAPAAPTGVTATAKQRAATVRWTAPSNNGAAITTYTVIPYLGRVAQPPRAFNASTVTRTITGLTTGKRYTFKVKATNARGPGPLSVASNAVTVT